MNKEFFNDFKEICMTYRFQLCLIYNSLIMNTDIKNSAVHYILFFRKNEEQISFSHL